MFCYSNVMRDICLTDCSNMSYKIGTSEVFPITGLPAPSQGENQPDSGPQNDEKKKQYLLRFKGGKLIAELMIRDGMIFETQKEHEVWLEKKRKRG